MSNYIIGTAELKQLLSDDDDTEVLVLDEDLKKVSRAEWVRFIASVPGTVIQPLAAMAMFRSKKLYAAFIEDENENLLAYIDMRGLPSDQWEYYICNPGANAL